MYLASDRVTESDSFLINIVYLYTAVSGRETALEAAKIKKCEWGGCLCYEAGSEMRV